MAGSPNKTANRFTKLEAPAVELFKDVLEAWPDHLQNLETVRDNPAAEAWESIHNVLSTAVFNMGQLGDTLRKKAKIKEPGPVQQMNADAEVDESLEWKASEDPGYTGTE